jgi:thiamine biosynthesis lipoprotein
MNTTITIKVVAEFAIPTTQIQNDIELAFGEFDRIVKTYTRFNDVSELAIINRHSGEWVDVSAEFIYLVKFMLQLAKATDGKFDPTIIDLLEAYGYSARYDFADKLADPELKNKIAEIVRTRPKWEDIELDEPNLRIKLAPKQRLDLGGVGKGYAIDCAYERLEHYANFLVDAGGDIRCRGITADNTPWQIGLKHRVGEVDGFIGKLSLSEGSVCASGSWARKVGDFHHIINPVSGEPENATLTAYTVAPIAMLADGWSTPLFLMGQAGLAVMPAEVKGLVINSSQKLFKTPDFPQIFSMAK